MNAKIVPRKYILDVISGGDYTTDIKSILEHDKDNYLVTYAGNGVFNYNNFIKDLEIKELKEKLRQLLGYDFEIYQVFAEKDRINNNTSEG